VVSDSEQNKQAAREYVDLAFNQGQPEAAAERYQGPMYIQHNPMAADGAEPFIAFVKYLKSEYPEFRYEVKRVIAEGDLVVIHAHIRNSPDDRGQAVVDILRYENGKAVEHWDVIQPIPETAENDNTMF
jgi:predicted SnoaL-like aldol condensation-catalyzing enzyme